MDNDETLLDEINDLADEVTKDQTKLEDFSTLLPT